MIRRLYRKLRLIVRSFLRLPATIRIVTNGREAKLSTRGYPTANMALWANTKDVFRYEPEETEIMERLFSDSAAFWDIGAQIGYYAILAKLNAVPSVLAVDIDKRYCAEVRKHAKRNGLDINVVCAAIGSDDATVLFANYAKISERLAVSLDSLVDTYGVPDLVKIDIDGGERSALLSGKRLFTECRPRLMIEFSKEFSNLKELFAILSGYGYHRVWSHGEMELWVPQADGFLVHNQ